MNEFTIRSSTSSDLAAIVRIERANPAAAHWSESEYSKLWTKSDRDWVGFVAESAGEIIGFAIARETLREADAPPEWELENMAVAPEFHGRGVGTALLRELLVGVAPLQTSCKMMLEVRESNIGARRLYENQGFEQVGRRKNYYGNPPEDALLFEKKFTDLSMKIR